MGVTIKKKERKFAVLTALKGRIREKGTSYREIADSLGIATNTLSDKINGFYAFNVHEIKQIAEILDIEPEQIVYFFMPDMALGRMPGRCEMQQNIG